MMMECCLWAALPGLNYFHPNDISSSQYKPPVILTDFQIFNKSVPVDEESF